MTLVYKAGNRVWRVRGLLWLVTAFGVWFVLWGIDLYQTYGLLPADGGALASHGVRLAWLAFMSIFGVSCAVGMWLYARNYISALWYDEATEQVTVDTVGVLGRSRTMLPRASILGMAYSGRYLHTKKMEVNAPWHSLRIEGRRWPLILDAQGTVVDATLLNRALDRKR